MRCVITRSPIGGYEVSTKCNADPLSALFVTPRYAATLWGARRLARKHQCYLAKSAQVSGFREVIGAEKPLHLGLIKVTKP